MMKVNERTVLGQYSFSSVQTLIQELCNPKSYMCICI